MLHIFFVDVLSGIEISRNIHGIIPRDAQIFDHVTGLYSKYSGNRKLGNLLISDNRIWIVSHISSGSPTCDLTNHDLLVIFEALKCTYPDKRLVIHCCNKVSPHIAYANFHQRYDFLLPILTVYPNSVLAS